MCITFHEELTHTHTHTHTHIQSYTHIYCFILLLYFVVFRVNICWSILLVEMSMDLVHLLSGLVNQYYSLYHIHYILGIEECGLGRLTTNGSGEIDISFSHNSIGKTIHNCNVSWKG